MVPKHIYEGTDYKTNPANNTPIGTGPFKFKEWVKGSHILLVKNENYYEKGKPHLDEIYWHVIPDAASRAVAFENGTVDILPGGSVVGHFQARAFGQFLHRFGKPQAVELPKEADGITMGATAKAVVKPLVRAHVERGRLFVVERAAGLVVGAGLLQPYP